MNYILYLFICKQYLRIFNGLILEKTYENQEKEMCE